MFNRCIVLLLVLVAGRLPVRAQNAADFPARPTPPRLVNDLAGVLSADQRALLEKKLVDYDNTSSTQVAVVTLHSFGAYAPAQYGAELFNRWGVGNQGKDNGVLISVATDDHKVNITTGYGVEGVLPDALTGRIIREEMTPWFRQDNYYEGLNKAADAVLAATKGEYTADAGYRNRGQKSSRGLPIGLLIVLVYLIIWIISKFRGGGGGSYMSGRGYRGFGGGFFGGMGGGGFGGGSWSGGSSGGGGFGGFGGGRSGGGGASGSW